MPVRFEIYSFSGIGGLTLDDKTAEAEFGSPVGASGERQFGTAWELAFQNAGPTDAMAVIRNATAKHEAIVSAAPPEADAPCAAVGVNEIVRRLVRKGAGLYLRAGA